jgi:phage gpG-like protein
MKSNAGELIKRIQARQKKASPGSPSLNEAFTRIALRVMSRAKLNIRRYGMIDTGRLTNSIRYEFYRRGNVQGIRIGSFGVPYAAINEYGGTFTDQMRKAMFANLRERGRIGKGSANKAPTIIGNRWLPRPYLKPALEAERLFIVDQIANALGLK